MKLKDLIKRARITEDVIVEPSEQVLKLVYKELKLKTGIVALPSKVKATDRYISYTTDMSKEIRSSLLHTVFSTMTLDCGTESIPQTIGGYSFAFSVNWTHPRGGSNGQDIGVVFFKDGKISSRF